MPKAVISGHDDGGESPSRPLPRPQRRQRREHTRARTGCERCRTRRRKCDEGKPRCQRCIDAEAECHYLVRLTFVVGNMRFSQPDILPLENSGSSISPAPDLEEREEGEQGTQGPGVILQDLSTSVIRDNIWISSQNWVAETGVFQGGEARDKIGTSGISATTPRESQIDSEQCVPRPRPANKDDKSEKLDTALVEHHGLQPCADIPALPLNATNLLKYYVSHVAPWLDAYDLERTFGLLVPILARKSPAVLEAVLRLTAASRGSELDVISNNIAALSIRLGNLGPEDVDFQHAIQLLTNFVLSRARVFVESIPDSWGPMFSGNISPKFDVYNIVESDDKKIWLAVVALMWRLDIAHSLMSETAPSAGPKGLRDMIEASRGETGPESRFQTNLCASLHCLALLSDTMSLCLEPADPHAALPTISLASRVARWDALFDDLRAWLANRPPELHPLAETGDESGGGLPIILFTNSAGVSTNMAFHASMLVLLSHRPRAWQHTRAAESQWSGVRGMRMSPLWHARQICGIALHSDEKSWEPGTLAAFALAARRMTHPDQQEALLECLNRVEAAGWRVTNLINKLQEDWGSW